MFPPGDLWFGSDTEPEMCRYIINFAFPILLATFDIWYLIFTDYSRKISWSVHSETV